VRGLHQWLDRLMAPAAIIVRVFMLNHYEEQILA
jgi:hypothetical protein